GHSRFDYGVFTSAAWMEWNRFKWGLRPVSADYGTAAGDSPSIRAVYYISNRGRVRQPPLNPYLPISFRFDPSTRADKLTQQWLECADLLVNDLNERGFDGRRVALNPGPLDGRSFQW